MTIETYLDHASSTPLSDRARQALLSTLEEFGDPLRHHANGQAARRTLDESRATVASAIGAQPDEIVFTSGGTESVALAILGSARPALETARRVVITAVEHPAVGGALQTIEADGFEASIVPVDEFGRVDLDVLAAEVREPGTLLASVQYANHEVGTMQPVAEAARLCREAGVLFHTDACLTVGHLPIDVGALDLDLLSLSAHKFGGPPGIGALFVRRGLPLAAYPCGDDRERKRRSGMENVPGVASMAAALKGALEDMSGQAERLRALSGRLRASIEGVPGIRVHGHRTERAPQVVCFSVADLDVEILAMALDDRGFRVAVGSICSGWANDPSPVLAQMGVPNTPSFRIGIGPETTDGDVDRLLNVLPGLVDELRQVEAASEAATSRFRPQER